LITIAPLNNQSNGRHEAVSPPALTGQEALWNPTGIASGGATPCLALLNTKHPRVIEEYSPSEKDVASFTDIESIRIDMKEVQHRVKNMVAIIQSISHQTMRYCTTKKDFDERFSARLSAFCRSLDCLIDNEWRGIDIHDLVRLQLTAFGSVDGSQISVNGPQIHLTPAAAHNIGMALHELATNAVKYGSLSVPQGRVAVNWELANIDGQQRFHMTWSEFGGALVMQPTHEGFGRRMIEQLTALALAGKATYEFLAKGVRWSIDIPGSAAVIRQESTAQLPYRSRLNGHRHSPGCPGQGSARAN
jgi:two-component sensor histidine kinase